MSLTHFSHFLFFYVFRYLSWCLYCFFFFHATATTEIYTLSLHDALPISCPKRFAFSSRNWSRYNAAAIKARDRKSTRLNSSHLGISYAVFCLKKKKKKQIKT